MNEQINLADGRVDAVDLEHELLRIPDVSAVHVVTDRAGAPVEIHVVVNSEKHPKQIARDVQSVALASFGVDLDRRMVSVVRLEGEEPVPRRPRVVLRAVGVDHKGNRALVRVALARSDQEWVGSAEGSMSTSGLLRLAATATLDALRHLIPAADCLDIDLATIVRSPSRAVALANVTVGLSDYEEVLAGSAVVRDAGDIDAMARAVLNAVNRRLTALSAMAR